MNANNGNHRYLPQPSALNVGNSSHGDLQHESLSLRLDTSNAEAKPMESQLNVFSAGDGYDKVDQLKLLKGTFDPNTLVAGKRTSSCLIRHTVSDGCQTFPLFVDLARCRFRGLRRPQPHQSALCCCCHLPPRARPTLSCTAPC